jgi:hypothetical protein
MSDMGSGGGDRAAALSAVKGPAICMMIAGILGLLFSILSFFAPAMLAEMAKNMEGVSVEQIQATSSPLLNGLFLVVNIVIILGALKLKNLESKGLAMVAAILSMINIGNCCCILGLPFGIWALVAMNKPAVKAALG